MRDNRATHNLLAVSATHREPGLNEEGILDLALLVEKGDFIKAPREGEANTDEATGKEEASYIYKKERKVEASLNFKRLQPQHLAFLAAYGLGQCVSTLVEAGVYLHTITPIQGDLDFYRSNPTFTAAQKLGDGVLKSLFASLMVDELTLKFDKGAWPSLTGKLAGTGKIERNLVTESVSGLGNVTSITLGQKVEGADAAGRLAAVHQVCFNKTGETFWRPVTVSAASSAAHAVLTTTAPLGTADAGTYEVIYVPDEDSALLTGSATSAPTHDQTAGTSLLADTAQTMIADEHIGRWLVFTAGAALGRFFKIVDNGVADLAVTGNLTAAGVVLGDAYLVRQFGWLPLPSKVAEPPLYVSAFKVTIGGEWDGANFQGGRVMGYDLGGGTWLLKNGLKPELTPGAGQSQVANQAMRGRREQTLELSRQMKDAVYQLMADGDFSTFGLIVEATGGKIGSTSHDYSMKVIFPMAALKGAEAKLDGERLGETLQVQILEGNSYPSVIVQLKNAWPAYAQA